MVYYIDGIALDWYVMMVFDHHYDTMRRRQVVASSDQGNDERNIVNIYIYMYMVTRDESAEHNGIFCTLHRW